MHFHSYTSNRLPLEKFSGSAPVLIYYRCPCRKGSKTKSFKIWSFVHPISLLVINIFWVCLSASSLSKSFAHGPLSLHKTQTGDRERNPWLAKMALGKPRPIRSSSDVVYGIYRGLPSGEDGLSGAPPLKTNIGIEMTIFYNRECVKSIKQHMTTTTWT